MKYPKFFDEIESVKLQDPLADVLGAFEDGEYEIGYTEVVKSAGHSCPTVAGAYIMASEAIKALYGEQRAVRGDIKVEFKESLEDGVAGVVGNVISHITGATDKSGFKGLNGLSPRHSLMFYNSDISSSARFTRIDNHKSVDVFYDHSSIAGNPMMMKLMQKISSNQATLDDKKMFGELWQERVKKIFQNISNVVEVR
jgi:hypothetical protein